MGVLVSPVGWRVGFTLCWKTNFYIDDNNYKSLVTRQVVQYIVLRKVLIDLSNEYCLRKWFRVIEPQIFLQNKKVFVIIKIRLKEKTIWKIVFRRKRAWFKYIRMNGALEVFKAYLRKLNLRKKRYRSRCYLLNMANKSIKEIKRVKKSLEVIKDNEEREQLEKILKKLKLKFYKIERKLIKIRKKVRLQGFIIRYKYNKWGRYYRIIRFLKKPQRIKWFLSKTRRNYFKKLKRAIQLKKKTEIKQQFATIPKFYYLKRHTRGLRIRLEILRIWQREKREYLRNSKRRFFQSVLRWRRKWWKGNLRRLRNKKKFYRKQLKKRKRLLQIKFQQLQDSLNQIKNFQQILKKPLRDNSDHIFLKKISHFLYKNRKYIQKFMKVRFKRKKLQSKMNLRQRRRLQKSLPKMERAIELSGGRRKIMNYLFRLHKKDLAFKHFVDRSICIHLNRVLYLSRVPTHRRRLAVLRTWQNPLIPDKSRLGGGRRRRRLTQEIMPRRPKGKRKAVYNATSLVQKKKLRRVIFIYFRILPFLLELKYLVTKVIANFLPQMQCRIFLLNVSVKNVITAAYVLEYVERFLRRYRRSLRVKKHFHRLIKFLLFLQKKFKIKGFKFLIAGRFARRDRVTYIWRSSGVVSLATKLTKIDFAIRKMQMKYSKPVVKLWICKE